MISEIRRLVVNTVDGTSNGRLRDELEQILKSYLFNKTKRRPMVFVTLNQA